MKKIEKGKLFINLFEECHILTVHVVTDLEKSPFSNPYVINVIKSYTFNGW